MWKLLRWVTTFLILWSYAVYHWTPNPLLACIVAYGACVFISWVEEGLRSLCGLTSTPLNKRTSQKQLPRPIISQGNGRVGLVGKVRAHPTTKHK